MRVRTGSTRSVAPEDVLRTGPAPVGPSARMLLAGLSPLMSLGITTALSTTTEPIAVEAVGHREVMSRLTGSADHVDLVILDPYRPTLSDGLALCRALKDLRMPPFVLALTDLVGKRDLMFCLLAGVDSVISSHEHPQRLIAAAASTLRGRREWVIGPFGERGELDGLDDLTPRETEILWKVRERWTNRQIGSSLSISPNTVKNHVAAILRKLGVKRRSDIFAGAAT